MKRKACNWCFGRQRQNFSSVQCCIPALWVRCSRRWGFGAGKSFLGGFGTITKEMGDFTGTPMSLHCLLLFEHPTRTGGKKISRRALGNFRVHWLSRRAKLPAGMQTGKIPIEISSLFPRGLDAHFQLQSPLAGKVSSFRTSSTDF